jgi:hypothetical protein
LPTSARRSTSALALAFPAGVRAIFSWLGLSARTAPAATNATPAAAANPSGNLDTTRRVYDRLQRRHNPRAYDLDVPVEILYCPT